jgi:hypothetical protein
MGILDLRLEVRHVRKSTAMNHEVSQWLKKEALSRSAVQRQLYTHAKEWWASLSFASSSSQSSSSSSATTTRTRTHDNHHQDHHDSSHDSNRNSAATGQHNIQMFVRDETYHFRLVRHTLVCNSGLSLSKKIEYDAYDDVSRAWLRLDTFLYIRGFLLLFEIISKRSIDNRHPLVIIAVSCCS